jgi:hypothetical protein
MSAVDGRDGVIGRPSRSRLELIQTEVRDRPLLADFVAEVGIPTARDGWWIF